MINVLYYINSEPEGDLFIKNIRDNCQEIAGFENKISHRIFECFPENLINDNAIKTAERCLHLAELIFAKGANRASQNEEGNSAQEVFLLLQGRLKEAKGQTDFAPQNSDVVQLYDFLKEMDYNPNLSGSLTLEELFENFALQLDHTNLSRLNEETPSDSKFKNLLEEKLAEFDSQPTHFSSSDITQYRLDESAHLTQITTKKPPKRQAPDQATEENSGENSGGNSDSEGPAPSPRRLASNAKRLKDEIEKSRE